MSAPEREPYQVQAITDLVADYNSENYRYAVEQCRAVLARVIAEDNRSDQQIARVKILRYLDFQLERSARWIEGEADLMAGVLRTLIELRFWADFVSKSLENATQFLQETNIDARELLERLKAYAPTEAAHLSLPQIQGKRINVQPTGDEEALLWKICSKLIHPSSWVLNHPDETIHNVDQRRLFSIHVIRYGWGILSMFHNITWT